MEIEDNTNALFVEPNAYIQHFDGNESKKRKKIVFQEPYETLPNYYLDNDFKKPDRDCSLKPKPKPEHKPEPKQSNNSPFHFPFDLKSFFPLLAGLFKNGGGLSNIMSMLTGGKEKSNGNFDFSSLLSNFTKGGELSNIFELFKGNSVSKTKSNKHELKETDFQIKGYTRVE